MIARGLALLVPLLALCVLWRARTGNERELAPEGATTAHALCGGDDCGCPHEVVPASCCCTPRVRAASSETPADARSAHVARPAPERAPSSSRGAVAASEPHASLTSFHCSGAKRVSAEAAPAPPAVAGALPRAELVHAPRVALARFVSSPGLPLEREPPTPPPRRARRA